MGSTSRSKLIPGAHGGRQLVPTGHRIEVTEKLHVSPVEMSVQAGLVLGSVRTQRAVELGFDTALVLQVPRQAGVVVVHLAAVLARIGDRSRLWKT